MEGANQQWPCIFRLRTPQAGLREQQLPWWKSRRPVDPVTPQEKLVLAAARRYSQDFKNYRVEVKKRKALYGDSFRHTGDEIKAEIEMSEALRILKDRACEL